MPVFKILWTCIYQPIKWARTTLLWTLVLIAGLAHLGEPALWSWAGVLTVSYLLLMNFGWSWVEPIADHTPYRLGYWLPLTAEYLRARDRIRRKGGLALARDLKLIDEEASFPYSLVPLPGMKKAADLLLPGIPGIASADELRKAVERNFGTVEHSWGLHHFQVMPLKGATHGWVLRVSAEPIPDPLEKTTPLAEFPAFDARRGAVAYGRDETGAEVELVMSGISGALIGGNPGSGKTAGLVPVIGALLTHPAANVAIFDGKGGSDWEWARLGADHYSNKDRNLVAVAEEVEAREALMRHRLAHQKQERGTSNFWDMGATAEHPVYVTVVDEVHTYVGASVAGLDKEQKEAVRRITQALEALLKKGRSAGMFTILATQKPTADSLPTALRDVTDLRFALRVRTSEATRAILGEVPDDPRLSPTTFDKEAPGFAIVDDGADFQRIRFYWIPEAVAEALIDEYASRKGKPHGDSGASED